ncbi:MAG: tetratricopeptide repeat protein [Vampirovibrionales bacterium]|nr:tetratricopeptide repeat protein [Vampirovibrionales bacterium]
MSTPSTPQRLRKSPLQLILIALCGVSIAMSAMASVPENLAQATQAWQAGNQPLACGIYQQILTTEPSNADATYGKALCLQQNQPAKALVLLQQLVTTAPNNSPAWLLLGELHEQQGHEAEAVNAYRHYVALGGPLPKSPSFRLRLKQWGLI